MPGLLDVPSPVFVACASLYSKHTAACQVCGTHNNISHCIQHCCRLAKRIGCIPASPKIEFDSSDPAHLAEPKKSTRISQGFTKASPRKESPPPEPAESSAPPSAPFYCECCGDLATGFLGKDLTPLCNMCLQMEHGREYLETRRAGEST